MRVDTVLSRRAPSRPRPAPDDAAVRPAHYLVLLATVVVLNVVGVVMVLSASSVVSLTTYGSAWYFFERQLIWTLLGAVAFAGEPMVFPMTSDGAAISQFFRQLERRSRLGVDRDRSIANFPTIAKRADKHAVLPVVIEHIDRGQRVEHAGRQQNAPRANAFARAEGDRKPTVVTLDRGDGIVAHLDARVMRNLFARDPQKFCGRSSVARKEPVHAFDVCVAWIAVIEQHDAAPRAPQQESGR